MSDNKLKQNFDLYAITSIISSSKDSNKQIIGWKIIGDQKITIDLSIKVLRKNRDEIVLSSEDSSQVRLLEMLASGVDKMNIYLPEDLVLFQSEIKNFDKETGRITIKYPSMFAQVERRKNLRLLLSDDLIVPLSFQKTNHSHHTNQQLFNKNCFDISAGGFSFVVSKTELRFFQLEDNIEKIKIKIDDKEFLVSAAVVNILTVEPDVRNQLHYKGYKVCFQFQELDREIQKIINSYVFRNSAIEKQVI